jgi:hypothetical protein
MITISTNAWNKLYKAKQVTGLYFIKFPFFCCCDLPLSRWLRSIFRPSSAPGRLWGPPSPYTVGIGGSFPAGNMRPGRDADHSPPDAFWHIAGLWRWWWYAFMRNFMRYWNIFFRRRFEWTVHKFSMRTDRRTCLFSCWLYKLHDGDENHFVHRVLQQWRWRVCAETRLCRWDTNTELKCKFPIVISLCILRLSDGEDCRWPVFVIRLWSLACHTSRLGQSHVWWTEPAFGKLWCFLSCDILHLRDFFIVESNCMKLSHAWKKLLLLATGDRVTRLNISSIPSYLCIGPKVHRNSCHLSGLSVRVMVR